MSDFGGHGIGEVSAVVVASHGRDEEDALVAALGASVPYVGLVASRRRGSAVVAGLEVDEDARARVRTPAGLDLGARTPEEVAVSILAEIVQTRPRVKARGGPGPGSAQAAEADDASVGTAVDPVCGMSVAMVEASLHYEVKGQSEVHGVRYWFCGSGCLRAFADDPSAYRKA